MSKNSPPLKPRRSKLRRSSIEGLRLVRVFTLKPSIQNGVFLLSQYRSLLQSIMTKLVIGHLRFLVRAASGGPDWARTSDPALIKRML
jgi:hypothetical protein